jgi:murein L,D-transpeptidase YcbB/YkuD
MQTESDLNMKYLPAKTILISILANLVLFTVSVAQPDPVSSIINDRIDQIRTTGKLKIGDTQVASLHILPELYKKNKFKLLWQNPQNVKDLLDQLGTIEQDGLSPEDYHLSELLVLKLHLDENESPDPKLLANYDILLTDSLIRLLYHLLFGKLDAEDLEPDWNMTRAINNKDPVGAIEESLRSTKLAEALENARPQYKSYKWMKSALKKYREIQEAGGWEPLPGGPVLKPGMTDGRIALFRKRLHISGDLTGPLTDSEYFDDELKNAIIRFQKKHRLVADGIVGKKTIAALNIPARKKIDQISVNLERGRWILHNIRAEFILVDIAGFRVDYFRNEKRVWSSKAQIGKPFRKTPVFESTIKFLVFNPTWTVPPTILQKDIHPRVIKNPAYLKKMKISVIDRKGRIVDPYSIDWSKYSGKNIPYMLRQEPGPHNALGRIKFIFPNKHFIYLHDTPSRFLFKRKDRAFSSGCIRVEKDIELAEILLGNPVKWNHENIQKIFDTNKTRRVNLAKQMPIALLYWTVRFDGNGNIIFKKDVYDRDREVLEGLNEEFEIWQRRVLE